jgi:hypothetical protein
MLSTMSRPRKKQITEQDHIEAINRNWLRRKTIYEPTNRYAGDPYLVRCVSVKKDPEPNLVDRSKYRQ